MRPSRGSEYTGSRYPTHARNGYLSETLDGQHMAGQCSINLHQMINPINAIATSELNAGRHVASLQTSILHQTVTIHRNFGSLWKCVDGSGVFDLHRTDDRELSIGSSSDGGSRSTKNHYQRAIVARSLLYRGTIVAHSAKNREPRPLQMMDHDCRAILAIKSCSRPHQTARIFRAKNPFKNRCILFLFLNFSSIREEIKRISRKVLSSRDSLLPRV